MWSPVDGAPSSSTVTPATAVATSTTAAAQTTSTGVLLTVPATGGKTVAAGGAVDGGLHLATATTTPRLAECRKSSPKLKLPPMFQMDSGSSYESYEAADCFVQQQMLRVCLDFGLF